MAVVSCENAIEPMIQDRAGVGYGTVSIGQCTQCLSVRSSGDGAESSVCRSVLAMVVNRSHTGFYVKSPDSARVKQSRRIKLVEHQSRMRKMRTAYNMFIGKRQGKIPLG
jgi:hypothetical protein